MDQARHSYSLVLLPLANRASNLARVSACIMFAALSLAGCDKRSESSPGSSPAAVGSGTSSSGRTEAGKPSTGTEVATPAAPDARGGSSTGAAGVAPVPDTSGGPSSGSMSPGASSSGVASTRPSEPTGSAANTGPGGGTVPVTPPQVSTNGGMPASGLGNSSSSGNTNSTPQSTTGQK